MVWIGIIAGIVLLDGLVKRWAEKHLKEDTVREVVCDRVILRKLHNPGAACSLGKNHPGLLKKLTASLWMLLFAGYLWTLKKPGSKMAKLGGAFVLGGGASNVAERLTKGYVTDYFSLNVKWKKLRNLVFNLSDYFILIGAVLAVLGCRKK